MALYVSHGLTLGIELLGREIASHLDQLLQDLAWVRCDAAISKPSLSLRVGLDSCEIKIPQTARELFRADGFSGLELEEDFYLTDGSSTFHSRVATCAGDVSLSPSFLHKPLILQRNFWAFALLKLLRNLGIFTLHAAGVTRNGLGVLIVGSPGSGKSTLAIGLVRLGWSYLSDDGLLLRRHRDGIEALALRKNFYLNADAASDYAEIPLGEEIPDAHGGRKRKLQIEQVYPAQYVEKCDPKVLLFSRIVSDTQSALFPCDRVTALKNLLEQSGPQLFDRRTMDQQLEVLSGLVGQTECYELRAGLDLYRDPARLAHLLAGCEPDERWLD